MNRILRTLACALLLPFAAQAQHHPERPENREPQRRERPQRGPDAEANETRQPRINTPLAKEFIERLRRDNPDMVPRLMQLRENDPKAFMQEVRRIAAAQRTTTRNRDHKRNPQEARCLELSRAYHESEDPEQREQIAADLHEAVQQAFESKLERYRQQLARLEREVEKVRTNLEKFEGNRDRICELRVDELTRPPELRWHGNTH